MNKTKFFENLEKNRSNQPVLHGGGNQPTIEQLQKTTKPTTYYNDGTTSDLSSEAQGKLNELSYSETIKKDAAKRLTNLILKEIKTKAKFKVLNVLGMEKDNSNAILEHIKKEFLDGGILLNFEKAINLSFLQMKSGLKLDGTFLRPRTYIVDNLNVTEDLQDHTKILQGRYQFKKAQGTFSLFSIETIIKKFNSFDQLTWTNKEVNKFGIDGSNSELIDSYQMLRTNKKQPLLYFAPFRDETNLPTDFFANAKHECNAIDEVYKSQNVMDRMYHLQIFLDRNMVQGLGLSDKEAESFFTKKDEDGNKVGVKVFKSNFYNTGEPFQVFEPNMDNYVKMDSVMSNRLSAFYQKLDIEDLITDGVSQKNDTEIELRMERQLNMLNNLVFYYLKQLKVMIDYYLPENLKISFDYTASIPKQNRDKINEKQMKLDNTEDEKEKKDIISEE